MLIIVCYQLCISKLKPNFSNRIYIIFEHIMMHTKHKKHIFHNLLYISTLLSVPQCIPYKECLVVHLFITPHNGRYSCPSFHEVSVADSAQHTSSILYLSISRVYCLGFIWRIVCDSTVCWCIKIFEFLLMNLGDPLNK